MSDTDPLTDAFDRGLREGFNALSPIDQDLFLIQDFIIEYEIGDLSAYFYNRLPDLERIRSTSDAMRRRGIGELAFLLEQATELFKTYVDPDPPTTWGDVLKRYDPDDRLTMISDKIRKLKDFGLANLNTGS